MKSINKKYLYVAGLIGLIGFLVLIIYPRPTSIPLPSEIDLVIKPSTGPYNFENTNNKFATFFKSNPVTKEAIKFSNSLASITFFTAPTQAFAKAAEVKPTLTNNAITYPNLFPQTDLKYSLSPTRLLEEFVVKDQQTALNTTKIIQNATTSNVDRYKEEADGSITFFNKESTAFVIPKPVMYEADNQANKSYGIKYEVQQQSATEYTINKVITPEGIDWFNDPTRKYPIIIDLVIDNADTDTDWVSSDATNTSVSGETSIKYEGTGSVKVVTTADSTSTLDLMEYSTDDLAQAAYVTNALLDDTNTISLLHMNGADASTTFTDEGGTTWTASGNHQIDTAQSVFDGASMLADGNTAANIYTADSDDFWLDDGNNASQWTVDFWARFNSTAATLGFFTQYQSSTYNTGFNHTKSNNLITFKARDNGTDVLLLQWTWSTSAVNTWYHIAVVKDGTNFYCFINGQSLGTKSDTSVMPNYTGNFEVGSYKSNTGNYGFDGWIDEFRISKGIARWTSNFTPPTSAYSAALNVSSESTIKTQGTYSLKGIATATNSLNKTLTRTIGSPIDLSNKDAVTLDMRSTRTGSNIKVGLHDSGGTTTEITPNITSADTFQEATIDLSGVSNANKDDIDQIIITVVNADSDNTFYLDNMTYPNPLSLDDTITLTKSATDLSGLDSISFWIRSTLAGQTLRFQFGESASDEQTHDITINSADTWEEKIVDISGISDSAKDAVTLLAYKITDSSTSQTFYFDDITTPTPASRLSGVTMSGVIVNGPISYSSGPNSPSTTADDDTIGTTAWTNTNYVTASDNSRATTGSMNPEVISHYLKATNFGFSIPTGSTINGVKVDIERNGNFMGDSIFDNSVRLVKGGTIGGDDKASVSLWSIGDAYASYGDINSLWGLTFTAEDINATDFGIVISAKASAVNEFPVSANIDHIRITVYYTQ